MKHNPNARHFVYRCFDRDGRLLYIGATSNYDERVKEYRRRRQVASIEREEYPTRAEAFAAELAAIKESLPPWNNQGYKAGTHLLYDMEAIS